MTTNPLVNTVTATDPASAVAGDGFRQRRTRRTSSIFASPRPTASRPRCPDSRRPTRSSSPTPVPSDGDRRDRQRHAARAASPAHLDLRGERRRVAAHRGRRQHQRHGERAGRRDTDLHRGRQHRLGGGDRHPGQHRDGDGAAATTDPNPANNSATDTDTLTPTADLAITKTDGKHQRHTPGQPVTTRSWRATPGRAT